MHIEYWDVLWRTADWHKLTNLFYYCICSFVYCTIQCIFELFGKREDFERFKDRRNTVLFSFSTQSFTYLKYKRLTKNFQQFVQFMIKYHKNTQLKSVDSENSNFVVKYDDHSKNAAATTPSIQIQLIFQLHRVYLWWC